MPIEWRFRTRLLQSLLSETPKHTRAPDQTETRFQLHQLYFHSKGFCFSDHLFYAHWCQSRCTSSWFTVAASSSLLPWAIFPMMPWLIFQNENMLRHITPLLKILMIFFYTRTKQTKLNFYRFKASTVWSHCRSSSQYSYSPKDSPVPTKQCLGRARPLLPGWPCLPGLKAGPQLHKPLPNSAFKRASSGLTSSS